MTVQSNKNKTFKNLGCKKHPETLMLDRSALWGKSMAYRENILDAAFDF